MAYAPIIGFGSLLEIDDGASNAYVAIVSPVTISAPFGEVATVDTSHMQMGTRDRTFVPGLVDNGVISCECIYNVADYNRLVAIKGVTGRHFRVTATDTGEVNGELTWTATVILTKVEMELELEGVAKMKFEAKITGAIGYGYTA